MIPAWQSPWTVILWSLLVQGVFLATSPLRGLPISAYFYGDALRYLETARRLAEGLEPLGGGLPYRPPLTAWLLVPLWSVLGDLAKVALASKILMVVLSAATYALVFVLLRRLRIANAFWIALLLPLSFGEMALASATGSEIPYRLLLVALLALELRPWRGGSLPVLALVAMGVLHGLATLTRAEHLYLAVLWIPTAALLRHRAWRPALRPALLVALATVFTILPYSLQASANVRAYNASHTLEEPLPSFVTVAFYGPLNFAMAQEGEEIFFEWTMPKPPGAGENVLNPTFPAHTRYILHGYSLGWETIRADPSRFVERAASRFGHSLHALAFGFTWRDIPATLDAGRWTRQPVDVAHAPSLLYLAACLALCSLGAWTLRHQPILLAVGVALLLVRLAINTLFFPYLRGVLIVSPFTMTLFAIGLFSLLQRGHRHAPAGLVVLLMTLHLATAFGERRYGLDGERRADGSIVDDRPVVLELRPPG